MRVDGRIPAIIDDLSAGALDDAAWQRGIAGITNLVRGASAIIFGIDPVAQKFFRAEAHGVAPEQMHDFSTRWIEKEIRLPPVLRYPVGEAMFDRKLLPMNVFRGSEIFNDFLLKIDKPWILCFWLHKSADKCSILSIHGSRRRGPMDESDGELVKPLLPHVQRTLEIRDRLHASRMYSGTLFNSLDNLSFGVMILDARGRVLEASVVAQELMIKDSGVRCRPDRTLELREPAGEELDRWLLAGTAPPHNNDGLLHVPRPLALPISVMVTPLPADGAAWISGDPRWMLLFFDPDRRVEASTELIARDLGVSEREAEVAALLVAGYDLKQVAARLDITIHTARTHLKSIFAKTGIRSQAELIRRIATGPSVLHLTS